MFGFPEQFLPRILPPEKCSARGGKMYASDNQIVALPTPPLCISPTPHSTEIEQVGLITTPGPMLAWGLFHTFRSKELQF